MMMAAMQGGHGSRNEFEQVRRWFARILGMASLVLLLPPASAQVNYVARFTLDKSTVVAGEPVFCTFSIENKGAQPFAFAFRNPSRIANTELESEPRFTVRDTSGRRAPDPAPRRCGGAKGTAVYGSVTLPPGQVHTERWLLNQWAKFTRSGRYRVRAERRLPLLGIDEVKHEFTAAPVAFAAALNELVVDVAAPTDAGLRSAFEPYQKVVRKPEAKGFPESFEAVVTLPKPFLLDELVMLASAGPGERRWERDRALEGLARLGTPEAWAAVLKIAQGTEQATMTAPEPAAKQDAFRAFAILLLAERGNRTDLGALLAMLPNAPDSLRGEIIRALGYFRDARANKVLFERLHSEATNDRVNAVLGLRNLEDKSAIPALIAMLSDSEAQVRQVAHFALRTLTGQKIELSGAATAKESQRVAGEWRSWWQKQGPEYRPVRQPACRDW